MTRKPDLPETEPHRCRSCKRHTVAWDGFFWACSRLTADPDTGDEGCGRYFVPGTYEHKEKQQ